MQYLASLMPHKHLSRRLTTKQFKFDLYMFRHILELFEEDLVLLKIHVQQSEILYRSLKKKILQLIHFNYHLLLLLQKIII
jgi:hypothetical protein